MKWGWLSPNDIQTFLAGSSPEMIGAIRALKQAITNGSTAASESETSSSSSTALRELKVGGREGGANNLLSICTSTGPVSILCTQACEQALHEVILPAVAAHAEQQSSKPVKKQKHEGSEDCSGTAVARLLSQVPLGFETGGKSAKPDDQLHKL